MFSGANPQRPMSFGDSAVPIELRPFHIEGGLGEPIKELIAPMLHTDPRQRPSAAELFPRWQDLYFEAAHRAHALEGRVV
jgi:hypothetical protein